MQKVLFFLLVAAFSINQSYSQTVNDIPIKDIDVEYIQIVGISKIISKKVNVNIDFGQENSIWSNKDVQVRDENGKKVDFNSMIDALNFMSKYGYEFVQAYAFNANNQNVYHYLMKKEE